MHPFPHSWKGYLINLPERTDRLAVAKKELARVGWVLGPDQVTLFPAKRFADRGMFPSAGARGAFFSHVACLRNGLIDGQHHVLLLEDDICFAPSLPRLAPAIGEMLEKIDWDFCYFGHEATGVIPRANSQSKHVKLSPYHGDIIGLHFCLVNARVLQRLLEHVDLVASGTEGDQIFGPMPIDGALNIFRRINPGVKTVIASPKLGWQRPSRSDITGRSFDKWSSMRPIFSALRFLKYTANRWKG